jgi:hypothetical protein
MEDLSQAQQEHLSLDPIPAGKVRLKHPHTGDIQDVSPADPVLVKLMLKGYSQVHE